MSANSQPALFTKLGFDPAYRSTFEDKLFIEGPQTARRLTTFFALLLFATVIATYGVLSDSTATVIGAMLVAPLDGADDGHDRRGRDGFLCHAPCAPSRSP